MRGTASGWVAVLALVWPSWADARPTDAQPPAPVVERPLSAALTFSPGATCLDRGRVESQVQAWLGRDRIASDVRVDVRGSDSDPHAVAFFIVQSGRAHERSFDHLPDECDDATAVVGLAIALAIDASVLSGVFAPPPAVAPPRRLVAIEVAGGLDVVPGTSGGAAVGLEYGITEWLSGRLDLGAQVSFGSTIPDTSGSFDTTLGYAAPEVCAGGAVTGPVRIELCSGVALGAIRAQGHGYAVSRSSTGPWVVATGGLRLVARTGFDWVLDLQGVFPLHVPDFRAENAQGNAELLASSPAGAMLSAGPVFFF